MSSRASATRPMAHAAGSHLEPISMARRGPLSRARQVAGQHPLVGADHRKPRVRRRLILTLEKPLGSCQPAAHRCHQGGIEKQVHRDANGRACCCDLVAGLQARRMRAFPRLDGHVEMARGVGDLAEHR